MSEETGDDDEVRGSCCLEAFRPFGYLEAARDAHQLQAADD